MFLFVQFSFEARSVQRMQLTTKLKNLTFVLEPVYSIIFHTSVILIVGFQLKSCMYINEGG